MKIVFFGTPDYVLPILNLAQKTFRDKLGESGIVAVVTQKPKPVGREKKITYSPVDTWAYKRDVPVILDFSKIPEADLAILAAFGEIIPEYIIGKFKFGILNIHPSLLPKFRGASPVQASILSGELKTGATIIKIDKEMDHGPVVSQFTEEILESDTLESLRNSLFERAASVLVALIPAYVKGKIQLRDQDHNLATYTTQVKKEHGFITPKILAACLNGQSSKYVWEIPFMKDFILSVNSNNLNNFIRALDPWPGAWTLIKLQNKGVKEKSLRLKLLKAHLDNEKLILDEVQLEGKGPVTWSEFQRGYPSATLE